MKDADSHSLVLFDQTGDYLDKVTLPSHATESSESLKSYIDQRLAVYENKKDDPISECQDPKTLPPPPECVQCKNHKIVCSAAKFRNWLNPPGAVD